MKKILLTSFIVALGLLGASCKDDNSTAGGGGEILPDQQVSCEIFMPTNGETVIISDKLIIRGENYLRSTKSRRRIYYRHKFGSILL